MGFAPAFLNLTTRGSTGLLAGGMSPDKTTLDQLRIDRGAGSRGRRFGWVIVLLIVVLLAGGAVATWWFTRPKPAAVKTLVVQESSSPTGGGQRTLLNASGYVTARRI